MPKKPNTSNMSHATKLKIVAHYLCSNKNYKETAAYFNVSVTSVINFVKKFENDDWVVKQAQRSAVYRNQLSLEIEQSAKNEAEKIIKNMEETAKEVNKLAAERIMALIPKEKSLSNLVKAYEISGKLAVPIQDPDGAPKTKAKVYDDISKHLLEHAGTKN